jgi:hypothetical protein
MDQGLTELYSRIPDGLTGGVILGLMFLVWYLNKANVELRRDMDRRLEEKNEQLLTQAQAHSDELIKVHGTLSEAIKPFETVIQLIGGRS